MTESQQQLLFVLTSIANLPKEDRQGVVLAAAKLREVLALHNDHGRLALALVVSELQAEG